MPPPDQARFEGATESIAWLPQLVIFAAALALLFLRRPDALLNPQFYAEDGHVWFAEAYNLGWWHALFRTYNGYFQTLPRLVALPALAVPQAQAPLVMNVAGLAIQALPVNFLLSRRLTRWGSLHLRGAFALAYLFLPDCSEVHASITNAQWHLALLACLVVLAAPPLHRGWQMFDVAVVGVCGLTGPFCLLLLPVAAFAAWKTRERWKAILSAVIAATAAIQLHALLFTDSGSRRASHLLGASGARFARMLAGNVYLSTIFGSNHRGVSWGLPAIAAVAAAGSLLVAYAVWKQPLELRLFFLFCALVFAASLANPVVPRTAHEPSWTLMTRVAGSRYWFFPSLAFAWILCWYVFGNCSRRLHVLGTSLLVLMVVGFVNDWRHPAHPDLHFGRYAERFRQAQPGRVIELPTDPPGWTMRLIKKR